MPSVLETLVEELGPGLDEKAKQSLTEVDPVSALAFLHRLDGKGEQVRNPSAFVATAVRTSASRGGFPGQAELESALQRLKQDGILDENALEVLHKGTPEDAARAVASFLTQEQSSVRNASAYVTRNVMNARKGLGPSAAGPMVAMMTGGGMGRSAMMSQGLAFGAGPMLQGFRAGGRGGSPDALMAKWSSSLDPKAVDALNSVGPQAAAEVLQEMDSKGATVRNPSAYIQRACENRKNGITPPGGSPAGFGGLGGLASFGGCGFGGCGGLVPAMGMAFSLGRYQSMLDGDAMNALQKVSPHQARTILANLESRAPTVRNPSAYVVRSVANLQDGSPAGLESSLDDTAKAALSSVPPEVAAAILEDLQSKLGSINNPSAYVQRAAVNAQKGEGAAAATMGGAPAESQSTPRGESHAAAAREVPDGPLADQLDESARSALSELSAEASSAILQVLEGQRGKVQNPSAYVLKAVGNARKGMGAGAVAAGASTASQTCTSADVALLVSRLGYSLDENAVGSLQTVGLEMAQLIVNELETKGESVRNPSAYVSRAVSNAKMGNLPPGAMPGGAAGNAMGLARDSAARAELQEEMAKLSQPLDAKATDALEEVGAAAALAILQKLNRQSGQVNNPNAYIMRACGNEKRGIPSAFGQPMGMGMGMGMMGMGMGMGMGIPAGFGPMVKRQRL